MAITRTTGRADARRVGRSGREAALASTSRLPPRARACIRAAVALTLAAAVPIAFAQVADSPSAGNPSPAGGSYGSQGGVPGTPVLPGAPEGAIHGRATGSGQVWLLDPSIDALFTMTDNVNLTSTDRKYDFVTQLTPGLRFDERSPHTRLDGSIQVPVLLYARTGAENNDVVPEVDVKGMAELLERVFYVEGDIHVSQQYLSPFGPQPADLTNATANRYTAQFYRVTPILKGDRGDGYSYELRDDNIWTNESNTSVAGQNAYTNELNGKVTREPSPLGWQLEYDRADTHFFDQAPLRNQLARAFALARQDVTLQWSLDGGYEENNFPGSNESGAIYGAGVKWHPTDRTTLDAMLEHRFFGASYHVLLDHRSPLSIWTIRATRDITTYPQQLAGFAGGEDVNALLNRLFSSRIADPIQRQQFVDQFIRERGLPSVIGAPVALFTQQVTLQESIEARAGLIGARNSLMGSVFQLRTEPVGSTNSALPPQLLAQDNNTQTGGSVTWTLKVTPLWTLSTIANYVRTVENIDEGAHTRQFTFTTSLGAALSPLTHALVGARWQRFWTNVDGGYREAAVFVGINHRFR